MSDPLTDAQRDQVTAAIFGGRKIQAIKSYREATGAGLKEAKGAVEAMEAELRLSAPEKFSAPPDKAGCMGVLLLMLVPALLWGWAKW